MVWYYDNMKRVVLLSAIVILISGVAAFLLNSNFVLDRIFVSPSDGFGMILPNGYQVRGPMNRNYRCLDKNNARNCKTYQQYDTDSIINSKPSMRIDIYPEKSGNTDPLTLLSMVNEMIGFDFQFVRELSSISKNNQRIAISSQQNELKGYIIVLDTGIGLFTYSDAGFEKTISSIRFFNPINKGNCYCDLCSGSCKGTRDDSICRTPPDEYFRYCAQNYCSAGTNACNPISSSQLKRNFLLKNPAIIGRILFQ